MTFTRVDETLFISCLATVVEFVNFTLAGIHNNGTLTLLTGS